MGIMNGNGVDGHKSLEISASDNRDYRIVTLENDLKCLLISDPETDKAAAAMDVRVGYFSDPDNIAGLAHFCEHMLFMGSKKYPSENEYKSFLSKNGGSSNAFTGTEYTNFHFDVNVDYLREALDIFGQFFIEPLFLEDSISREICAVNSESSNYLKSDGWRTYQLQKSMCSENHPFHKFNVGNFETLRDGPEEKGICLRDELIAFHRKYYSSNIMRLAVLGNNSLNELEEMVVDIFSKVNNKNNTPQSFPTNPYLPEHLSKRVNVVPMRESRSLELFFPMREVQTLYRSKPTHYLSHLLGHEGQGSILAFLKSRGWGNELSCGQSRTCKDWSTFSINVELTDEGLNNVEEVVEVIFAYIELLNSSGTQEWVFKETSDVANFSFRFLSKRRPIDYVTSIAGYMHLYDDQHILSGPYRLFEYDPDSIEECLSFLKLSNMIMFVSATSFEGKTSRKEKWYGTDYEKNEISDQLIARCKQANSKDHKYDGALHLPIVNDLIATDFEIKEDTDAPLSFPRILMEQDTYRIWWKPDNVFKLPKLNVIAHMRSCLTSSTPKANVLAVVWVQILDEYCIEFSYNASVAGLHSAFSCVSDGIEIHLSGYNQKLEILLKKLLETMMTFCDEVDVDLFERIKDKMLKKYSSFLTGSQPYQHAIYVGDLILEANKHTIFQKIEELEKICIADLKAFSSELLSTSFLEVLVHGNSSVSEAHSIANHFVEKLGSGSAHVNLPEQRVIQLKDESLNVYKFRGFNETNVNNVVEIVLQVGPTDIRENAKLAFLKHIIQEPCFDELRTKEQLGYIVHTSIKTSGDNIKSLLFLIQSDLYDASFLNDRVEAFLEGYRTTLASMSDDEFKSHVNAVEQLFLEKDKNLGEETSRYWNVISNRSYNFDRYQKLASEVKVLSLSSVLAFFDKYISLHGSHRKKLSIQLYGSSKQDEFEKGVEAKDDLIVIDHIDEFKRSCSQYPLQESVDVSAYKMIGARKEK